MIEWFRSWHGAPTDPKWLGIARKAGIAPGITVAIAWALMDRASQAEERGSIAGYDADGLACFMGCEPEQVEAVVGAMESKGVLREGRFSTWESRQPKREDPGATERVKAWRERTRSQRPTMERAVTQTNEMERLDKEKKEDTDSERKKEDIRSVAKATRPKPTEDDFDLFWKAYPRRDGPNPKAPAKKLFDSIVKLACGDAAAIVAGARGFAAEVVEKKTERQFVAQAMTWLRQRRWEAYQDVPIADTTGPPQPPDPSMPSDEELRRKYASVTHEPENCSAERRTDIGQKLQHAGDGVRENGQIDHPRHRVPGNPPRRGGMEGLGAILPRALEVGAVGDAGGPQWPNPPDAGADPVARMVR